MKIGVVVDQKEIRIGILNATKSSINASLYKVADDVRRELKKVIEELFKRSPEYNALLNGVLKEAFSLDDPEVRLDAILGVLKDSVHVSIIPVATFGGSLQGGINIGLITKGYVDLLSLPQAVSGEKINIAWLDWLLHRGNSIILNQYKVEYKLTPEERRNRNNMSAEAILTRGGGYRVPAAFSGTESDNWISRTFDLSVVKKVVDQIVERSMARHIK